MTTRTIHPRKTAHVLSACAVLLSSAVLFCAAVRLPAQIPEQYPRPLVHTATNHPATRVLLLSIDGLHAVDLANFVAAHPHSALATLTARGVTYTDASTPVADPLAGLASLVTGGTPISNGVLTSDGFDRTSAPNKPGNPAASRVNTIFEVVHEKIGPTAWAGESAATTNLLRGPSGKGLDEACPLAPTDAARVANILHLIDATGCTGTSKNPVPSLFGMSFTAIAQAQRTAGYTDALATPSPALAQALAATDAAIATILAALQSRHLYDTTWLAIISPYAQSPLDPRQHRTLPLARIRATAAAAAAPNALLHITGGGSAMLWLSDPAQTAAVAAALSTHAAALGIQSIRTGAALHLTLNTPAADPRMPDIVLQPLPGLRWTTTPADTAKAGFGGMLEEDTHVALLISGAQLTGRFDPTPVPTTQLAPLLLRALGMEKFDLDALHTEHSPALPGIF